MLDGLCWDAHLPMQSVLMTLATPLCERVYMGELRRCEDCTASTRCSMHGALWCVRMCVCVRGHMWSAAVQDVLMLAMQAQHTNQANAHPSSSWPCKHKQRWGSVSHSPSILPSPPLPAVRRQEGVRAVVREGASNTVCKNDVLWR